MENHRLLYLVQHSNNEMFKIGIGTNNHRFQDLDRDYSIDWESSLYFQGENHDITKMERILHKLFHEYRLDKQNGTGGTEWFSTDCLNSVVESILFNVDNSRFKIELQPNEIVLHENKPKDVKLGSVESDTLSWNERKKQIFKKYPESVVDKWKLLDDLEPNHVIVDEMNRLIPEFYCMLKPSVLTQMVYIEGNYKNDFSLFNITPLQLDLINIFFYDIGKRIIEENIEIIDSSNVFDFKLKEICELLGKYKNRQYTQILEQLGSLSDIKIVIENLGKNTEIETKIIMKFINEIKILQHKKTEARKIKLVMSNTIINAFLQKKYLTAKRYLKIQLSMVSKYSKLLYEVLKEYEGIKNVIFSLYDIIELINVTCDNQKKWMYFNQNILKKSVSEINEKSDIKVSYEPIKEKIPGQRKQVTKIKFNMEKHTES